MSLSEFGDQVVGPKQAAIENARALSGISTTTNISGMVVNVSGMILEISGEAVTVSGNIIQTQIATVIRARPGLAITAASGGTILASGDVKGAVLVNKSGNSDMYVGGVQTPDLPYSGNGIILYATAALSLDISNFNKIAVCATTSGQILSYGGNQF